MTLEAGCGLPQPLGLWRMQLSAYSVARLGLFILLGGVNQATPIKHHCFYCFSYFYSYFSYF